MMHPSLEDLTAAVHGWIPPDAHLHECATCRTTAERLRDELTLLRRAEERVTPPPSGARVFRLVPLALAVTVLMAVLATILLHGPGSSPGRLQQRNETPKELVRIFLEKDDAASARARRELAALGRVALADLAEARRKNPDAARKHELAELLYECKKPPAEDPARQVWEKVATITITIDIQNSPLNAVVDYLREITGSNIVWDSVTDADAATARFKVQDMKLPTALDGLLIEHHLEYDFRHGVLFISPADRLWSAPPDPTPPVPLGEAKIKEARDWISRLASDKPEERDRAHSELKKLGPSVIPVLEEGTRAADSEAAARCRALMDDLRPRSRTWGSLPIANHWRSQTLADADRKVAEKLESRRIDLAFENTAIADILEFIKDFSGLKLAVRGELPKPPVTFKVKGLTVGEVLELCTLPYGWDVTIEEGAVTFFERKK